MSGLLCILDCPAEILTPSRSSTSESFFKGRVKPPDPHTGVRNVERLGCEKRDKAR